MEIYVGLFLLIIGTGAGLPVPEEAPLVGAGILARQQENQPGGTVVWPVLYGVCVSGVVLGDLILYLIGRHWGPGLLGRRTAQRVLPQATQDRVRLRFTRHGSLVVVLARFTPGTRIPVFLMAGALGLTVRSFLIADGLATVLYVGVVFGLAYILGDRAVAALEAVQPYKTIAVVVVIAASTAYLASLFQYRSPPMVNSNDKVSK